MPPGVTTNASDMIMKWCSREKKVRCVERLRDERIHLLLERQLDVDADGAAQALWDRRSARLHWPPA